MSSRAVFLAAIALFAPAAIGCSGADATPAVGQESKPAMTLPPEPEDGGAPVPATAGIVPHALGSPLCNASISTCFPDDPNSAHAMLCGLAPDGGTYSASAGYDNAQLACHVQQANGAAEPAPVCTLAGKLTDTSSTPCSSPTDCAAGFECVTGGACRHYCCAGECFDPSEFCDIQQTTGNPSIRVPVCTPIHACGLLDQPSDAGSCGALQTCAVVRVENGATSCVAIGSSNVGEPCDTQQCLKGLTCLGAAGDRHCYKLCHTAPGSMDCPAKQTCRGGLPLFPMPGVGICQ
jgi:hypothetical protein